MGTRSLTYVYNDNNGIVPSEPLVCMYRQFDGYPTGHGAELAQFLNHGTLVNGLRLTDKNVFNGMGCLAAQMIANFKQNPGNFYLYPTVLDQDCWQEYEYHVFEDKVKIYEGYYTNNKVIFDGTWKEFEKYCSVEHYDEENV